MMAFHVGGERTPTTVLLPQHDTYVHFVCWNSMVLWAPCQYLHWHSSQSNPLGIVNLITVRVLRGIFAHQIKIHK